MVITTHSWTDGFYPRKTTTIPTHGDVDGTTGLALRMSSSSFRARPMARAYHGERCHQVTAPGTRVLLTRVSARVSAWFRPGAIGPRDPGGSHLSKRCSWVSMPKGHVSPPDVAARAERKSTRRAEGGLSLSQFFMKVGAGAAWWVMNIYQHLVHKGTL